MVLADSEEAMALLLTLHSSVVLLTWFCGRMYRRGYGPQEDTQKRFLFSSKFFFDLSQNFENTVDVKKKERYDISVTESGKALHASLREYFCLHQFTFNCG